VEPSTTREQEYYRINYKHRHILRTASYGTLRRVALIRTEVSEELSASIIRVTKIGELGTLAYFTDSCHLHDGGASFPRNVGS
jgi:hypothetical protein